MKKDKIINKNPILNEVVDFLKRNQPLTKVQQALKAVKFAQEKIEPEKFKEKDGIAHIYSDGKYRPLEKGITNIVKLIHSFPEVTKTLSSCEGTHESDKIHTAELFFEYNNKDWANRFIEKLKLNQTASIQILLNEYDKNNGRIDLQAEYIVNDRRKQIRANIEFKEMIEKTLNEIKDLQKVGKLFDCNNIKALTKKGLRTGRIINGLKKQAGTQDTKSMEEVIEAVTILENLYDFNDLNEKEFIKQIKRIKDNWTDAYRDFHEISKYVEDRYQPRVVKIKTIKQIIKNLPFEEISRRLQQDEDPLTKKILLNRALNIIEKSNDKGNISLALLDPNEEIRKVAELRNKEIGSEHNIKASIKNILSEDLFDYPNLRSRQLKALENLYKRKGNK